MRAATIFLGVAALAAVWAPVHAQQTGSSSERVVAAGQRQQSAQNPASAGGGKAAPQSGKPAAQPVVITNPGGSGAIMPTPYPNPKVGAGAPQADLVQEALDNLTPLTPEEVRALRSELKKRTDAATTENITDAPPPTPGVAVFQLDLAPKRDTAPPVVRVTTGQGSVVAFVDAAGKPWKILEAENFGKGVGIAVSQFTDFQLAISVKPGAQAGNVAVALEGLPKTITFTVLAGQRQTDYAVQMVVPQYKDGAPQSVGPSDLEPSLGSSDLIDFALRTPPANVRELTLIGLEGAQAWQTGLNKMVLRTDAILNTPAFFRRRASGIDNIYVYELPISPALLVTKGGRFITAKVSGFVTAGAGPAGAGGSTGASVGVNGGK